MLPQRCRDRCEAAPIGVDSCIDIRDVTHYRRAIRTKRIALRFSLDRRDERDGGNDFRYARNSLPRNGLRTKHIRCFRSQLERIASMQTR
jgi:hypothetical protein